jgi:hypothetical protein
VSSEKEHEVWSIPPGRRKAVYQETFSLARWQWAEKLAAYLRDEGHREVEVLVVDQEPEDEKDEEEA